MSWNNRGGLAHNPPFVVPVQVDPALNDFVPLFTGYVLDCVVNTANQNQARALFKELLESDQNFLSEVVQTLASVVEFYVISEGLTPQQVEVATRNSVEMVVNAYLAMAVNSFPQEFGRVIDDRQAADVQNYIGALEEVKFNAQRFYQGGGQGFMGNTGRTGWQPQGRGRGTTGGGWRGNAGGGRAPAGAGAIRNSRWDEPEPQGGYQSAATDNWPGNRMGGGSRVGGGGASNWGNRGGPGGGRPSIWDDTGTGRKAAPTDASFNSTGGGRLRREFDQPARNAAPVQNERRNVQPIVANQSVVDGVTFIPVRDDREWPKVKDLKRIWDHILSEDGTQIRPAFLSDWTVSFDPNEPFTPLYNPDTHILFHYKSPEGAVSVEAIQREDSMNYLDHELDPHLRRKGEEAAREREGKLAPAWQMVEHLRPNPSHPLATAEPLSDDAEGENVAIVTPDTYLVTSSLPDAIKRACLKLKVDRPDVLKQAFELYVDRGVLTTLVNPDFGLLFQLSNAGGFKQLFQMLIDLDDEELKKEADARLVTAINQGLQQNMGLVGWTIGNFLEDYGDLIQALKEDHGDTVAQTFEGYSTEMISRALAHYTEADLDENVRKVVGLDEGITALVWLERSSITRLPVTSDELRLPVDTGVLVSASRFPEIHKTLDSIYDRTLDMPQTFYGRYIATTDGVVYSVAKGYLNEQATLLFKAPFTLQ